MPTVVLGIQMRLVASHFLPDQTVAMGADIEKRFDLAFEISDNEHVPRRSNVTKSP